MIHNITRGRLGDACVSADSLYDPNSKDGNKAYWAAFEATQACMAANNPAVQSALATFQQDFGVSVQQVNDQLATGKVATTNSTGQIVFSAPAAAAPGAPVPVSLPTPMATPIYTGPVSSGSDGSADQLPAVLQSVVPASLQSTLAQTVAGVPVWALAAGAAAWFLFSGGQGKRR